MGGEPKKVRLPDSEVIEAQVLFLSLVETCLSSAQNNPHANLAHWTACPEPHHCLEYQIKLCY